MANYMGKRPDKNLIIGLDVGNSKIAALVGEVGSDNSIEVIGIGVQPSRGLKKGVVVNIESTVQSIQRAIEEAELMAGCEIRSVFAGIAGSHVRSLNSHGVVAIRDREVSHADVEHVVDAAKAVAIPMAEPRSRAIASSWARRASTAPGSWMASRITSAAAKGTTPGANSAARLRGEELSSRYMRPRSPSSSSTGRNASGSLVNRAPM